jgi:hypothetical protein
VSGSGVSMVCGWWVSWGKWWGLSDGLSEGVDGSWGFGVGWDLSGS